MKSIFRRLLPLSILLLAALFSCDGGSQPSQIYDAAMSDGILCVILDSGHGLSDTGALNEENLGTLTEADINFAITCKLAELLTGRGYTVVMTHDGKTQPETEYDDGKATYGPSERADFSNANPADLFISIHSDSFPSDPSVYGTRVYYPVDTPNSSSLDKYFAQTFKKTFEAAFPNDKQVIMHDMHGQDCYTVLYKTTAPSVLIETGFISNKEDAARISDGQWQAEFATVIADAIDAYFAK